MPEPRPSKSLIVSLHDAHPGSRTQIEEQVSFLAERGVACSSILVVPEFHHGGTAATNAEFCATVSGWQQCGHELVLHGYFHDRRESPPENLATIFWTRLYTNQEAEFLDLPLETARQRLERGRSLFDSLGWRTSGFVAPAWLMTSGLPALLAEMGFAYTTRVNEIVPLGGQQAIRSQSLCYSTRAGWRRTASALWNKHLFGRLCESELIRLSLHPRDLEFPLMRRQIDQIVRAAIRRGFHPTTYGEYVAR